MNYSRILGTGSYLPSKIVTNDDIAKFVDTSDEWVYSRTGIKSRHIAETQETVAHMSFEVAQRALSAAKLDASAIDMIIVATCTPDTAFPTTACQVQAMLGLHGCAAFDVGAVCAGFTYGLAIADQFIRTGQIRHALVVGCEIMSRILDWTDRTTCVLFGDGAAGVVLGVSNTPGVLSTHLHADGAYGDLLRCEYLKDRKYPVVRMKGSEVFKVAVNYLSDVLSETLVANQLTVNDIDWFIPHQANTRIIQAVMKKLNLPSERVILTVEQHGNTSAASVPLALDAAVRSGKIKRGDTLLLESFGAGFAWGSALIKY